MGEIRSKRCEGVGITWILSSTGLPINDRASQGMADVVMAMPSLLKPYFQWHCHWMPILPLASEQWEAFLDAPVPFLTGVPRGHTVTRRVGASVRELRACFLSRCGDV